MISAIILTVVFLSMGGSFVVLALGVFRWLERDDRADGRRR